MQRYKFNNYISTYNDVNNTRIEQNYKLQVRTLLFYNLELNCYRD